MLQYPSLYLQQYIVSCLVLLVSRFCINSHFAFSGNGMLTNLALFSASVGLSFLQFTNMNSMRNLFITGVALFLGLSVPDYFREYTAKAFHGPAHTNAGWVSFCFHLIFSMNMMN